eukprot:COSAG01_NODE_32_length_35644_cov_22.273738_40_plen_77_part_00
MCVQRDACSCQRVERGRGVRCLQHGVVIPDSTDTKIVCQHEHDIQRRRISHMLFLSLLCLWLLSRLLGQQRCWWWW